MPVPHLYARGQELRVSPQVAERATGQDLDGGVYLLARPEADDADQDPHRHVVGMVKPRLRLVPSQAIFMRL